MYPNDTNQPNYIKDVDYCAITEYLQRIDDQTKEEKDAKEESVFDSAYRLHKSNGSQSFISLVDLSQNTHMRSLPQQPILIHHINNTEQQNRSTCWYSARAKIYPFLITEMHWNGIKIYIPCLCPSLVIVVGLIIYVIIQKVLS